MGRVLEFVDKDALERAMYVFWENGYPNTSLKDLLAAMNILNGSFYNAFGNNKNVYLKALQIYEVDFNAKIKHLFSATKADAAGELPAGIDPGYTAAAINVYTQGLMKLSLQVSCPNRISLEAFRPLTHSGRHPEWVKKKRHSPGSNPAPSSSGINILARSCGSHCR